MTLESVWAAVVRRLRNRKLLENAGLLLLANVIVTLFGIMRTPLTTWILPKDDVGALGVVAAWMNFIVLLSLPGMDAASYHYIAKGNLWALPLNLRIKVRWSLLAAAGFLAGAAYWYWQGEAVLAAYFVAAALLYYCLFSLSAGGGTLAARERFRSLFWFRIAESLVAFAGFIPLVLSIWWISKGLTYLVVNQTVTIVLFWLVIRRLVGEIPGERRTAPAPEIERGMVAYGRHLTVLSALSVAQSQVDSLLVATFLPLGIVADYAIATIVANQFRNLWGVYVSVRYPVYVRMQPERLRAKMQQEGLLAVAGFTAVAVVAWFAARFLIPIILPASYTSSIPYIGWLFAAFLLSLPGALIEIYFRTQQDERRQYALRLAALVPSVLLPAALIYMWDVQGVLWGRLLAAALFSLIAVVVALFVRPSRKLPAAPLAAPQV